MSLAHGVQTRADVGAGGSHGAGLTRRIPGSGHTGML
jgi:hypothetical protein